MARSGRGQTRHDQEVRRIATRLEGQGYDVKADVRGFSQPPTIRGFRPDVLATKGRERKIVEVETRDSLGTARDENQRRVFAQAADQSKCTSFRRTVAD